MSVKTNKERKGKERKEERNKKRKGKEQERKWKGQGKEMRRLTWECSPRVPAGLLGKTTDAPEMFRAKLRATTVARNKPKIWIIAKSRATPRQDLATMGEVRS